MEEFNESDLCKRLQCLKTCLESCEAISHLVLDEAEELVEKVKAIDAAAEKLDTEIEALGLTHPAQLSQEQVAGLQLLWRKHDELKAELATATRAGQELRDRADLVNVLLGAEAMPTQSASTLNTTTENQPTPAKTGQEPEQKAA